MNEEASQRVTQVTLYNAYYNWARHFHPKNASALRFHSREFEQFMGYQFDWYVPYIMTTVEISRKLQLLAGPHYHAVLKVHAAQNTSMEAGQ